MVDNYNKTLYKLLLIFIKYVPFLIAIMYFIAIICGCFGVQLVIIPNLFFYSPITAGFWILCSFVFKCCIWHRLPIYYSLIMHGLMYWDYYSSLIITGNALLFICFIITLIFILLGMYFKNQYNVKRKHVKTSSS